MESNQQFNFIQSKIEELGSAIFFNQSEAVLKLPTSIVTRLKVDDFGYIWFYVQKPNQQLQEFEQEFPVRLDFFRKGLNYFLQVEGNGWVVNDPEEITALGEFAEQVKAAGKEDLVLVKVKMTKAEYHEPRSAQRQSWWDNALQTISSWFGSDPYRVKQTYFPAS